MPRKSEVTRRAFIETVAAAGAAAVSIGAGGNPLGAQGRPGAVQRIKPQAPDGKPIRAGLIGCGGRGTGAAENFLDAGPNLQVVALADVFPDKVKATQRRLKERRGQDIPDSRLYTGFDAYQQLIASDVDVVLNAVPPHFRPMHAAAIIDAGKHAFLEKPLSVDVPGAVSIMQSADKAASRGLCVMTGTQLRRSLTRIEVQKRVRGGEIGDIRAIRAIRNQGALWYVVPQSSWSDMEYQLRDWVNWGWLSGDIIVEQHIHHLDAMLWITGKPPAKATGMGARVRRKTGDQYDFFSIDYEFDDGVHMHSTIRQLNGCANDRQEIIVGTKGAASLDGVIYDLSGKPTWKYSGPETDELVQEHADWITAIRTGKPVNTMRETATSTLIAIMGRDSAYTGKAITWADLNASTSRMGPTEYTMGPLPFKPVAPLAGIDDKQPPRNTTV